MAEGKEEQTPHKRVKLLEVPGEEMSQCSYQKYEDGSEHCYVHLYSYRQGRQNIKTTMSRTRSTPPLRYTPSANIISKLLKVEEQ
jgi:hypothetical protein